MYEEYQVRVHSDGTIKWYQNGNLHRLDGPAVEYEEGHEEHGYKEWYQNGNLHRLDGPAIEWPSGSSEWYCHGNLHRLDGPAIEYVSGIKSWYIEDEEYTEEEFHKKIQKMNPTHAGKEVEIDGQTYILTPKK